MFIEDGRGSGKLTSVTDAQQLEVQSESRELIFYQSWTHGEAYTLAQVANQTVTASAEEVLCHIKNTSNTKYLCISHIHVAGYGANGFARVYVDSTYSSDGTAYTPGNHNRQSGNTAEATVYVADGSLAVAGGAQVCTKGIATEDTTAEMDFNGSIILGLNDTMDVRFLEKAGATPDVALCVEGYYLTI